MRFGERRSFGGGRRFGGPRFDSDRDFDQPKPIKVGEEYDVEIKETGSKGDGIARISNFVVFVNGAKLGEKIRVRITDVRNRFAIGEKTGAAENKTESTEASEETEVKEMNEDSEEGNDEGQDESSEESEE